MKRLALALIFGATLTVATALVLGLIFQGNREISPLDFVFGPFLLAQKLGFFKACLEADSISDKLGCVRTAFLSALVFYTAAFGIFSFLVYRILAQWFPRRYA